LERGDDGQTYSRLALGDCGNDNEYGRPALPAVFYTLEIPSGMDASVAVTEENLRQFAVSHLIWPQQPPIQKTLAAGQGRSFVVDRSAYGAAKGAQFQKARDGSLEVHQYRKRGRDYVDIIARPFAYHAQQGLIQYPEKLHLQVTYSPPPLPKAAGPRPGLVHVLLVTIRGQDDVSRLIADGYEIDQVTRNTVVVYASDEEVQALQAAGFPFQEVEIQPAPGGKDFSGYHSYGTLTSDLQAYAAAHPDICRLTSIGQSVQGRELWAMKITTNPDVELGKPRVRLGSTLHGDEPVGVELSLRLTDLLLNGSTTNTRIANLVASTEIWILPLLNPDGLEAGTRNNATGYDLNRSFPEGSTTSLGNPVFGPAIQIAGRPPEVINLMKLGTNHSFTLAANFHTGSLVVNYPYDNDARGSVDSPTPDDGWIEQLSRTYSSHNPPMWASPVFPQGIVNGAVWYLVNGGMQDWHYRYPGCTEVTIELANAKEPPASQLPNYWADNMESMLSFIEAVHCGVEGMVTDAGTGQPLRAVVKAAGIEHGVCTDPHVGDYHRLLLPGRYNLVFSAPGYQTKTVSNVVVGAGGATRLDASLSPAQSQDTILLVTHESLRDGLLAFKAQKESEGYNVQEIVMTGSCTADQVRTEMRNAYQASGAEYAIILGDTGQIPTFYSGATNSDLLYALMDPGESFSVNYWAKDLTVGRVSLPSNSDIQNYVQKLSGFVSRSQTNKHRDLTWIAHGHNLSEYQFAEATHEWCISNCVPQDFNHQRFYDLIYDNGGSAAPLNAHINAGTDGVIYSGHASWSGWEKYNYNIAALSGLYNNLDAPIVFGHCCESAEFDVNTCFGEGWLLTTSRGIAYCGATANSYWDEDDILQRGEFAAMGQTAGLTVGKAMDAGLARVRQQYPSSGQYYYTIYHLLGDPTVGLFARSAAVQITSPAILPPGNVGTFYSASLQAQGGTAPYTWQIGAGSVPDGIALDGTGGMLQGTPTQVGTNQFTLLLRDASQPPLAATQQCALFIGPAVAIGPRIITDPQSQAVSVGADVTFSVGATGTEPLGYYWRRNGTPIAGASASSYMLHNAQVSDSGSQFSCLVSNAAGMATSQPATLTVTPPVTGFVTRQLPAGYLGGVSLTVSLVCAPPAGASVYAVEDRPPAGWIPGLISDGGVLDVVSGKVKYGPFFDNTARTLTCQITPPVGTTNRMCFVGTGSVDGVDSVIGGDSCLEAALTHSADSNADGQLVVNEVTAYGAAWKNGTDWPLPPNPIPIGYVTRAGALWRWGECYRYDGSQLPPLCWVNCTKDAAAEGAKGVNVASRVISGNTVLLTVVPAASVSVYAVEEGVPPGFVVSGITPVGGVFDVGGRKVKWGPFFDNAERVLSYTITPEPGASKNVTLVGTGSFDGVDVAITGQRQVGENLPALLSLDLYAGVMVTGTVGQTYRVEWSPVTDGAIWTPLATMSLTNTAQLWVDTSVPIRSNSNRLFRAVHSR
jgi:carboxypeptidase D